MSKSGIKERLMASENFNDYSFSLAGTCHGKSFDEKDLKLVYTGYSCSLNRVWGICTDIEASRKLLDKAISRFEGWKSSFVLFTAESQVNESEVLPVLEENGFKSSAKLFWPVMALWLDEYCEARKAQQNIVVNEVREAEELVLWLDVIYRSFGAQTGKDRAQLALLTRLYSEPNETYRHYVAMIGGKAVGACSLFVSGDCAGVYWVATVPERRRQGLGKVILTEVLHAAKESGSTISVLQSTSAAVRLYEKLGYKVIDRYYLHLHG